MITFSLIKLYNSDLLSEIFLPNVVIRVGFDIEFIDPRKVLRVEYIRD